MDIESLKIIAETIGGLGHEAKWGVIAWVGFTEGVKVVVAGIVVFGIGSVVKHIANAIKEVNIESDRNYEFLRTAANMMGVPETMHGEVNRSKTLSAVGAMLVECRALREKCDVLEKLATSKSSLK